MLVFLPQNSSGLLDGSKRARQGAVSAESSQVAELACFSTENPIGLGKKKKKQTVLEGSSQPAPMFLAAGAGVNAPCDALALHFCIASLGCPRLGGGQSVGEAWLRLWREQELCLLGAGIAPCSPQYPWGAGCLEQELLWRFGVWKEVAGAGPGGKL